MHISIKTTQTNLRFGCLF